MNARTNERVNGKRVVPVILLHGFDGQRTDFDGFARYLQAMGHAVLVPDLRGHGESVGAGPVDRDRMNKGHFALMLNDVVACKKFFLEKNNAGQVNIEMLTVVGSELGALVAANWVVYDWSLPQLPTYRQGRDAKAIVMISPIYAYKGYTARQALASPILKSNTVAALVIVGARDPSAADARRIYKFIESGRGDLPSDPQERALAQTAYSYELDTSLSGTRLLYARGLRPPPAELIVRFIDARLVSRAANFPWQERRSPLADNSE